MATIPGTNDVIFTNSQSDAVGAEVTHGDTGTKQTIPLNLDQDATANQQLVSVHSPNGVAVFTYTNPTTHQQETYAFVAGRADIVNDTFFIDQDENPLTEGGNIGIIKDPYGPDPQLIAATRPIPDSYPTDLALSGDGQYLYVSYQGLPVQVSPPDVDSKGNLVLDANGLPVDDGLAYGGIMVFNAQAIVAAVDDPANQQYVDEYNNKLIPKPNSDPSDPPSYPLLSRLGIDDLYVSPGATDLSGVFRQINTAIDVQAEYDLHGEYVYDNQGKQVFIAPGVPATQEVFGIPFDDAHQGQSNPQGPIGLGVQPGGIAIQHGPALQLSVLQPEPTGSGSSGNGGVGGVGSGGPGPAGTELVATNTIIITTTVDEINKTVSTSGGDFDFSLNMPATVKLEIQDAATDEDVTSENIPDPTDNTKSLSLEDFMEEGISLTAGAPTRHRWRFWAPRRRREPTTSP